MRFRARTWLISGILYISYIVYATLLPFDFSFSLEMVRQGLANVEWIERYGRLFYISKNIDIIANFFFFLPLGIIIYNTRHALGHHQRPVSNIILATILGMILSASIEFMQLLIEARRTSYIDLLTNTLGCFSGALLAAFLPVVLSPKNVSFFRHFLRSIHPLFFLFPLILVGLLLTDNLAFYFLRSEKVGNTVFNWQYIIQPIWIWRLLFFYIPLGMLTTRILRNSEQVSSIKVLHLKSFALAICVSIFVEIIKYVLFREKSVAPDMLFGLAGIITGIGIAEIIGNTFSGSIRLKQKHYIQILMVLIFVFMLLIVYKFAYPFQLNYDKAILIDKSIVFLHSVYSFIPFTGILKLLIYSIQSVLLFIPPGMLIMELDTYLTHRKKEILLPLSIALVVIPVFIQFFNHFQTPFMYQIPTNALGLFLGYTIWNGMTRDRRVGDSNEGRVDDSSEER